MFSPKKMQDLQEQYKKMMEEIEQMDATGSSSGELVKVTLTGKQEMSDIVIDPDCVDPKDVTTLQELIKQAHASAKKELEAKVSTKMPGLGGMKGM